MQINSSSFEVIEFNLSFLSDVYEILKDNNNWEKLGMERLPTYERHVQYWTTITSNARKKEFLILAEKTLVGVFGFKLDSTNESAYFWIFLKSCYTKKGLGSSILRYFEVFLFEKDIKNLYTSVQKSNLASQNFFQKNGFHEEMQLPNEFDALYMRNRILFQKELNNP